MEFTAIIKRATGNESVGTEWHDTIQVDGSNSIDDLWAWAEKHGADCSDLIIRQSS